MMKGLSEVVVEKVVEFGEGNDFSVIIKVGMISFMYLVEFFGLCGNMISSFVEFL